VTKIKLGQQRQAGKPIYLLPTGVLECGRFRYEGRHKKKFKLIFSRICLLANTRPRDGVVDISDYKYWDAMRIYQEYVVATWCKAVTARRMEKFANETEIVLMIEGVKREFKRAVGVRWKTEFKKSDPNSVNTPHQAWQIL
jgi:hypothetical protein